MKTRFYSILCTALVLGTVSCSKEVSPVVEEKPVVVSLTAGFDDVKTTVANDGKVAWAAGDQLWVKCGSETAIFTLDPADAGKNVGKFTTTSVMDFTVGSSLEAYYPAEVGNNGSPVWPAEQTYSENMGCPMHATATIATEGTAPQLSFKNLGSILRLSIGTSQAGKKVKSILVSSTTPLAGAFSVDADGKAVISGTQTDITLDCGEEGIEIGTTPKTINVAIPANATSEAKYKDFYVAVTSADDTFAESTMKDLSTSFKRNTVYDNSTFTASVFKEEVPSNCYIVAPNTTETINAMHMGHSLKVDDRLEGVVGAELLWETVNTTEAPAQNSIITDLSYANGYVTFTTGSIPGNAYIVAKDSEDNTVWGWHIWVVEGGVVPTITSADGKTTFQAYDLGGLSETTHSLRIQYGRSCPTIGICGTYDDPSDMAACYFDGTTSPKYIDVNLLEKHTDRYGKESTLDSSFKFLGFSFIGLSYWYAKSNSSNGDALLWTQYNSGKSVFDPCPAGYRIGNESEYRKFLVGPVTRVEYAGNNVFCLESGWKMVEASRHTYTTGAEFFAKDTDTFPINDYFYVNPTNTGSAPYLGIWHDLSKGVLTPSRTAMTTNLDRVRCVKY